MKEIWKFYKTTYNKKFGTRLYEVSDLGCVKCNGKPYKCYINKDGYYYLCGIPLHRIVAELFLTDWDPNKEVDHINTLRTDNRASNLCMCTCKENKNNPLTKQHRMGKGGYKHTEEQKLHQSLLMKQSWAKRKKQ